MLFSAPILIGMLFDLDFMINTKAATDSKRFNALQTYLTKSIYET